MRNCSGKGSWSKRWYGMRIAEVGEGVRAITWLAPCLEAVSMGVTRQVLVGLTYL
jgi:hypothetical protein